MVSVAVGAFDDGGVFIIRSDNKAFDLLKAPEPSAAALIASGFLEGDFLVGLIKVLAHVMRSFRLVRLYYS